MKFDKLFNKLYASQIIAESAGFGNPNTYGAIPRPNRMKTPPNYYGSTGQNAKYYDLYIQDQAEGVFVDKYGNEKGHNAWQGIISVGNAMWKASDEILGQRRSMDDDNYSNLSALKLKDACTDWEGDPSWIVNWTWWILINIIKGQKYTHNFISDCIPTFKGVKQYFPITTGILLQKAGIDVDNFQLSKKIQARRDAEAVAKAEQEQKARQELEKARKKQEQKKAEQEKRIQLIDQGIVQFKNVTNHSFSDQDIENLKRHDYAFDNYTKVLKEIGNSKYDLSVGLNNLLHLPEPTNKDEQRIYDIVVKSNSFKRASVIGLDTRKAINLAYIMNEKITGEPKRLARKQAALKYGLPFLARIFS